MGRRAHGEGSVFQQADGRWVARLELPRDPVTGRRRRRKVTAATQAEVLRKRDDLRRDIERGATRSSRITKVADWLQEWSVDGLGYLLGAGKLRPSTVESYRRLTRNHLVPHLGGEVLRDLDAATIERAYLAMMRDGLSASSVGTVHTVLSRALDAAVRSRAIVFNPCRLVDPPAVDAVEAPFLEPAEVRSLLAAAPPWDRALWAVMAFGGLRLGEALGLEWRHLDHGPATLAVEQTLRDSSADEGGIAIGPPKSAASQRVIPATAELMELLRTHKDRVADMGLTAARWEGAPAMFPSRVGTWQTQSNVQRRFRRLRDQLGLPSAVRPHTLRHSAGAAMTSTGAPPMVIAIFLGHSTGDALLDGGAPRVTGRYLHHTDAARSAQLERIREAVERAWTSA